MFFATIENIMSEMSKPFFFLFFRSEQRYLTFPCVNALPVCVRVCALTKQRWQDDLRGVTIYGELA